MGNSDKSLTKARIEYVDVVRAVACMLITNSHFHGIYPFDVAFGGCPGNCLFFLLSGFLFAKADLKKTHFVPWYFRKLLRLHISLIIVNAINVITGFKKASVLMFLLPIIHNMWFVTAIAILYAICFLIHKYLNNYRLWFIGAAAVIYVVLYSYVFDLSTFFVERKLVFIALYGFISMEIGSYIYIYISQETLRKRMSKWLFVVAAASIVSFLGLKLMINRELSMALKLQFLTQVFSLSFAVSFFIAVSGIESNIMNFLEKIRLKRLLLLIGECTLEIYLVQPFIINKLIALPFPINFILTCVSIVFAGWVIHWLSARIYKEIMRLLEKSLKNVREDNVKY